MRAEGALLAPARAQGALPERSYRAACARAFSLRFLVRRFPSATRFLLFTALRPVARAALPDARSREAQLRVGFDLVAEVGFEPTTFGL